MAFNELESFIAIATAPSHVDRLVFFSREIRRVLQIFSPGKKGCRTALNVLEGVKLIQYYRRLGEHSLSRRVSENEVGWVSGEIDTGGSGGRSEIRLRTR